MQEKDVLEEINANRQLAESLEITGTPACIIGDQVVPGYVESDDLTKLIALARAKK